MNALPDHIHFSLEVFPPKTEKGVQKLMETVSAYTAFDPSIITVTFGAGGAEDALLYHRDVVRRIAHATHLPVAAHITCANRSCAEVDAAIDGFWEDGVRYIVALRGDILTPDGLYHPHPEGYFMVPDFVAAVKKRYPAMQVFVAGYPEGHPESPTEDFDFVHLQRKIDAGADGVLTQFFFDPDIFLRWRDKLEARGMRTLLVPGLLPILNFQKTCALAQKCRAQVPSFLAQMFDGVDPDGLDHKLLAMNVLSHQITRLIENGVSHFHFYTMNDTLLTRHLCVWLRAAY